MIVDDSIVVDIIIIIYYYYFTWEHSLYLYGICKGLMAK